MTSLPSSDLSKPPPPVPEGARQWDGNGRRGSIGDFDAACTAMAPRQTLLFCRSEDVKVFLNVDEARLLSGKIAMGKFADPRYGNFCTGSAAVCFVWVMPLTPPDGSCEVFEDCQ
jgi:hypothetical protein